MSKIVFHILRPLSFCILEIWEKLVPRVAMHYNFSDLVGVYYQSKHTLPQKNNSGVPRDAK